MTSYTQILVPRPASVLHKPSKMIDHRRLKWLELYFCLLLSETHSSQSRWYPFWNSDAPTSQSLLKQSYTEETNSQNNNDKAKKPLAAIQFRKVLQYHCVLYVHAMAILVSCPPQHRSIHIKYNVSGIGWWSYGVVINGAGPRNAHPVAITSRPTIFRHRGAFCVFVCAHGGPGRSDDMMNSRVNQYVTSTWCVNYNLNILHHETFRPVVTLWSQPQWIYCWYSPMYLVS